MAPGVGVRFLAVSMSLWLAVFCVAAAPAAEPEVPAPIADAHLHYEWNQAEVTSPEEAVQALRDNNVQLAVVTGTPAERALELARLAPEVVVPIYGVYRQGGDWYGWQGSEGLVEEVREALASGAYRGIGELHLIGGFAVRWTDRFVIGSDAVWPVERLDAWDQADTGWQRIGKFLGFHRRWASFLPEDVRRKVLLENALEVFRAPAPGAPAVSG